MVAGTYPLFDAERGPAGCRPVPPQPMAGLFHPARGSSKVFLRRASPSLEELIAADAGLTARPIAHVALAVYAGFTAAHFFLLEGTVRDVMVATAALSVLAIAVSILLAHKNIISDQVLLMAVLSIATANSILHMGVTGEARQSTNFVLLIVAVGFFVLEVQTMAALLIALVAAWLFVMPRDVGEFTHYAFALLTALVLAITMGYIRRRMLRGRTS